MFYDLVKDADILVENYRGGVTKKLGIDYETVKKINHPLSMHPVPDLDSMDINTQSLL